MEKVRLKARFESLENLKDGLKTLKEKGLTSYEAYAPVNIKNFEDLMPRKGTAVRIFATSGALIGLVSFFLMCVLAALIYPLVLGGKPPVSRVPFVVVTYEGTILLGALFAFFSCVVLARLWPKKPPADYDPRYSEASFGIEVECDRIEKDQVTSLLKESGALEVNEY